MQIDAGLRRHWTKIKNQNTERSDALFRHFLNMKGNGSPASLDALLWFWYPLVIRNLALISCDLVATRFDFSGE